MYTCLDAHLKKNAKGRTDAAAPEQHVKASLTGAMRHESPLPLQVTISGLWWNSSLPHEPSMLAVAPGRHVSATAMRRQVVEITSLRFRLARSVTTSKGSTAAGLHGTCSERTQQPLIRVIQPSCLANGSSLYTTSRTERAGN